MIADEQVVLHRTRRDLERLHDERADEQRKNDRDGDRLEVLANRRFLERLRHAFFVVSGSSRTSTLLSRSSARQERPPAESRRARRVSSASSLPSASRATCACARCRRRSTWP